MASITRQQVLDLHEHYAVGESLAQIADRCGYTREGVRKAFQREGLPLRDRKTSKNITPEFVTVGEPLRLTD